MKLKFKQSVYVIGLDLSVNVGDEFEIEDENQALSLVEAGMAEGVEEPIVIEKKEDTKPVRKTKVQEKAGE